MKTVMKSKNFFSLLNLRKVVLQNNIIPEFQKLDDIFLYNKNNLQPVSL